MVRRDYLQKQIDLLGRVLGKILSDLLGLKSVGVIMEGIDSSYLALKEELNLDLEELIELSNEDFIQKLQTENKFSSESLEKLAEIMLVIADKTYSEDNSTEKSLKMYIKCIALFHYVEKIESTYSIERNKKIEQIKQKTEHLLKK